MRNLSELIDNEEPAFPLVQQWVSEAELPVVLLAPSSRRGEVLHSLQVTTRSPMGAIAYDTGGILVDQGWLRLLGSGSAELGRDLASWNAGRAEGFLLIGDDVLGGFFAVNGGALGPDQGHVHYLAADTLKWESLGAGYSAFVQWCFTRGLRDFYGSQRRAGCITDAHMLSGDQCLNFYPPLWTTEGGVETSSRRPIAIDEQWSINVSG